MVIQAASCSVRVTGRRACRAASWLRGDPGGGEPGLQGGLQGPGDQPVLRLHVVVLASRPVGFEAGALGGALEDRQVLAVAGLGVPQCLDGGRQGGGLERGEDRLQHWLLQPAARDLLAGLRAVHLLGAPAPVSRDAVAVVDLHEPPAPAAPHQALEPGPAFPRSAAAVTGRDRLVRGQGGDVGLEGVHRDVTRVMIRDHHPPLLPGQPALPGSDLPVGPQVLLGPGAAIAEDPRIGGMGQDVVHRRVPCLRPHDLAGAQVPPGKQQLIGAETDHDLPGRPEFAEPAEHRGDRLGDRLIRRDDHLIVVVVVEPGGQVQPQLPAGGLAAQPFGQPRAQQVQLSFGHGALQAEQQPVVDRGRMVDAIGVGDQRVGQRAQM